MKENKKRTTIVLSQITKQVQTEGKKLPLTEQIKNAQAKLLLPHLKPTSDSEHEQEITHEVGSLQKESER